MKPGAIYRFGVKRGDYPFSSSAWKPHVQSLHAYEVWVENIFTDPSFRRILKRRRCFFPSISRDRSWIEVMLSRWYPNTHTYVSDASEYDGGDGSNSCFDFRKRQDCASLAGSSFKDKTPDMWVRMERTRVKDLVKCTTQHPNKLVQLAIVSELRRMEIGPWKIKSTSIVDQFKLYLA